ncbi:MAG TPA: zinc ribbon domain-containing protein [Gemmatimonadaceae bacterium]|jgi:putative FmdB family regulatory protein
MPTYEYRCPDGHDFEKFFRKISDAQGDVICPVCGKVAERKMSAGAGLLFKGSGFYLTDYGKNAHRGGPAPTPGGESKGAESKGAESKGGESKGGESSGGSSPSSESGSGNSSTKSDSKPAESKAASTPAPAPKPKSDS